MKLMTVLVVACALRAPVAAQPVGTAAVDSIRVDSARAVPLLHPPFDDARAIEADPFGALYVADAGAHVVVKIDTTGFLLERIGGPGSREGAFDRPVDVDPTNGLVLLVADAGNGRIQLLSRSNAFLGSIPLARGSGDDQVTYRRRDLETPAAATGTPAAVASFGSNAIVAVDSDRNAVLQWNENRRLVRVTGGLDAGGGALGEPVSLWIDEQSLLYVADRARRTLVVFDEFGSFVRTIGRIDDLVAVTGRRDEILAVSSDRIRVYNRHGRFLKEIAPRLREPVVDVAVTSDGTVFALTSRRAYRLHW